MARKKKPEINLITLLAVESPKEASELVMKHGYPRPNGYHALIQSLTELYQRADDKLALEKELAAIHPHKNWVLKNCQPEVKEPIIEVAEVVKEATSNASGCGCGCGGKCGCGGNCGCGSKNQPQIYSNFDATSFNAVREASGISKGELIIGAVTIVGIIALTMYYSSKKQ